MKQIGFIGAQRKVIKFEVDGKVVRYFDDIWKSGIQILPKDKNVINKLIRSHNPNFKMIVTLIVDANRGENLEQYKSCKTEDDLIEIIRKDCRGKGLMEIK